MSDQKNEMSLGEQAIGMKLKTQGVVMTKSAISKKVFIELINLIEEDKAERLKYGGSHSYLTNVLFTAALNAIITAQMAVEKFLMYKD